MKQLSKDLKWTTALAVVLAVASTVMTSADSRHRDAVGSPAIAYTNHYLYCKDYNQDECLFPGTKIVTPYSATAEKSHDSSPTWSPDSVYVAFVRSGDVLVTDAAYGTMVNITNAASNEWSPSWSPDGQRLAFVTDRDGSIELYVMAPDGSNVVRVTTNHGTAVGRLTWSANSTRVAFTCQVDAGNTDVCAINTDGTGFLRLTHDPAYDGDPAWSPDGNTIAFATARYGDYQLAFMGPDGSGVVPVGTGIVGWQPAWSPDGRQIAFVSYEQNSIFGLGLYIVDADGTNSTLYAYDGSEPAWMPTSLSAIFDVVACTWLTCTFDARRSYGDISAYGWGFGDQATGAGVIVSHTYAVQGQYTVYLTVTDSSGATVTHQRVISVPVVVANFNVACIGLKCTFDATGSTGNIVAYSWRFGDQTNGGSPYPVKTHTYAVGGQYTVDLTVNDGYGSYATRQHVITLNLAPVASFTATCSGVLTCLLDPSASYDPDGSINRVEWTFGDGATSDCVGGSSCLSAVQHTYPAGGTYTATVRVTDVAGATSTTSRTFTVATSLLHVGDIDRATTTQKSKWSGTVTISVHDGAHQPVANVLVTASWNTGGAVSCTTNAAGSCAFTKSNLTPQTKLTLTVTNVQKALFFYQSQGNHDPDGDSNGTTIQISK